MSPGVDKTPSTHWFGCWKVHEGCRASGKEKVLEFFEEKKGTWHYSDIAETLGYDLELVVDICDELEKDGEIGEITFV